MNNNALVAALGSDAVAAVHGYRVAVVDEARGRGLTLRPARTSATTDPIDIRLVFADGPGGALPGQVLTWGPQRGWAMARAAADPSPRHLAGPLARPLDLVPTAADVLDRVTGGRHGRAAPPAGCCGSRRPAATGRPTRSA